MAGTCSIGANTVAFGNYTPGSSAQGQGTLTIDCTAGTTYAVAFDEGLGGDGTTRRMQGVAGSSLSYDLYRDSGRAQRWGSAGAAVSGTGSGAVQTLPVYAAIPPASAAAGSYGDTVTVTLTY